MRKGFVFALAAALMLGGGALADGAHEYWTRNADLYYHANRDCGGMEGAVPISEAAAQAFDKHVCPVCIPEEDAAQDVQAVVRGGTIVVRFSDAWLAQPELTGVFGWSGDAVYAGEEGQEKLAQYLHGDAYNAFLADYLADGSASGLAREPAILATDGELIMNSRHIGSDWYIVVRPAVKFADSWNMYWRINGSELRMEDGSLTANFSRQTVEEHRSLSLSRASGAEPVYEYAAEDVGITVYRELDANIAVIFEQDADADFLEDAQLRIGGVDEGIEISGYMDGAQGVYCCTLTDAELARLQAGAGAFVWHEPLTEGADYMGTPYAEVRRGTGGCGVIDREGNFVVEAKYKSISRPHPDSFRITSLRPFFCDGEDGGLTLLHGETLEVIAQLKETDGYLISEYVNPAVFITRSGRGMTVRSLADGSVLFELTFDASGNYGGEITNVDGYFRVLADGMPTRMAAWQGDGPTAKAWLIDNSGNRVSDDFQRITPLVWSGEKGVFLAESFDPAQYDDQTFAAEKQSAFEYGRAYDGSAYGEGWRCGLIDQDGNILAEMKYTALDVLEDGAIWLTAEDGNTLIWQASAGE